MAVDGGLDLDLDLAGERGVLELVVAEAEAGVGFIVVWRVLASWQSASAGRKRLMAMYAAARLVRYAGSVETRSIALVYRSTASPYLARLNDWLPCSFNFSASATIATGSGSGSGSGSSSC